MCVWVCIGVALIQKRIWGFSWSRTGAVLYGGCPGDGGGSVEGTGQAVGAAVIGLVVISRTRVTGNQTGAGEMTCRTGDCRSGENIRNIMKIQTCFKKSFAG